MDELPSTIHAKAVDNTLSSRVEFSLLKSVYAQAIAGLSAAFFCAIILFIGLDTQPDNGKLMAWGVLFIVVMVLRVIGIIFYKLDPAPQKRIKLWRNIYVIGSLFGGISWGLAGWLLFHDASASQQMLMVLMLAGVTAGVIPLSSAVPAGALAFLIFSVMPFIITIATFNSRSLDLFDICLSLYLVYSIFLVIKNYRLAIQYITLSLENNFLLKELELTNVNLEQAATHDPLTQVANRRLFTTTLKTAIDHAKTHQKSLALIFLDLDKFKTINDIHGHHAGDQVLQTVTHRLRKYFRKEDIIARLGGDEFAVVIENFKNKDDLATIAGKICSLITAPIYWNNIRISVGASIGISIYPDNGHDEVELLQNADRNMYRAKDHGGNCYKFSDKDALSYQ